MVCAMRFRLIPGNTISGSGSGAAAADPGKSCSPRAGVVAFAAVLAAAGFTHLPALFNGFVWDDIDFILRNPILRDAGNIPALFINPETWGTSGVNPYYRPLTTLTFLVDTLLWGDQPAGFHATNLLLHLGVCALLLTILRRLLEPAPALAAALLFALHPAHAEPVAFVSARADLLCALFLLAAFLAWMRHGETGGRVALSLSVLSYFAALFAKIAAGLYPAVFALYGLLYFHRRPRLRTLLPFAAAALLFLTINALVLDRVVWKDQPLVSRVASAGPIIVHYVLMALSPLHLRVFHGFSLRSAFDATAVLAWIAVVAAVVVVTVQARRIPRAALALAWFLAGLVPVSGLVTALYPALVADRYLYLPLLGAALAVGAVVQRLPPLRLPRPHRGFAAAAAILVLLSLASYTMARDRLWRDPVTLWERATLRNPRNQYVLNALAVAYMEEERDEEALKVLLGALKVNEANAEVHLNLVTLAFRHGNLEAAERHTFRALELAPGSERAYRFLGGLLHQNQDVTVAMRSADRAIDLGLLDAGTLVMLGARRGQSAGSAATED